MPLEIWADLLEDQGQDTSALRAWTENGVISQGYGGYYCDFGDGTDSNQYGEGIHWPSIYGDGDCRNKGNNHT